MKATKPLSPLLCGVAGEYFVAAELSSRGLIASVTMRNTKGVDILCSNSGATKTVGIQVKTNRSSKRDWMLNQKVENYHADNLFFVFVNLNDGQAPPDYFVVPSKVVATYAKESHRVWLDAPGQNGRAHMDTTMRHFRDTEEQYLNRWDLLDLES